MSLQTSRTPPVCVPPSRSIGRLRPRKCAWTPMSGVDGRSLCYTREGTLLASHDGMHGQSGLPLGWPCVVLLPTAYTYCMPLCCVTQPIVVSIASNHHPVSISLLRRRKEDTSVGTAARGIVA